MIHHLNTSSPIQNTTNHAERDKMDMRASRPVDRTFAMPGGFPTYAERPRERSRPPTSKESETETSPSRTTSQSSNPLKSILKNSAPARPQDPLAARFYRVSRPEQMYPASAPQSPTYPSDSDRYTYDLETDTQSASSDLSINTQATSVLSDATVPPKPAKPSTQVKHVRHVPLPTNRVRTRPRTRTASEVTAKPPVPEKKRTVHIQFVPQTQTSPQSQELQLARRPDKDLLYKIEQLESETDTLRKERSRLNRDLDDASVQLSTKGQENKEIIRILNHERNTKELILRDLEEQRNISDEFRSNYQLQHGMLLDLERERDTIRHARDELEKQVAKLGQELARRDAEQKEQEEVLRRDRTSLESTTTDFQKQIGSRNKEIKELTAEVKDLNQDQRSSMRR
ncbi:hypothetical protein F4677DRAFT_260312 [Hypoxylon crocopeplum]|nr:hypothetical protein F4677DRAFT_260312 [Hypoxylon crocopeplum]